MVLKSQCYILDMKEWFCTDFGPILDGRNDMLKKEHTDLLNPCCLRGHL